MRIDSHQHFWYYHPQRESWINDSMAVIRRDFLPSDLLPVLQNNKMDGCIAVQANESEDESRFLLDLASKNSFIKGVVGWVDLTAEDVEQRLAFFAENPLFKGIRHALQAEPAEFFSNRSFLEGISKLEAFNLTYDLLILEHQLPEAIALVRKFPGQRFVLDHMAKPQISKGLSSDWVQNIKELASLGNVYCKTSGFLTETEDFKWDLKEFFPFLETVTEAFGEDKVMYGSDWPVCLSAGTYQNSIEILTEFFTNQDEIFLDKVFGRNAIEFYRL